MRAIERWLQEIEERCRKATKGPWCPERSDEERGDICYEIYSYAPELHRAAHLHVYCEEGPHDYRAHANAHFIAHARTDLPRLVEHARELRAVLRELADGEVVLDPGRHDALLERASKVLDGS